jgi:predicted nucleic acid-binding protein
MGSVLLDTTVVIDLLRGRRTALARLRALRDAGDAPYVCAINVEETVRGLRHEERDRVRGLFAGLREAPLGSSEGWVAGEWRRDFAARGVTLSQADCLVAASAAAIGGRLMTGNPKDFPMDGVSVEHWPVGV